MVVLAWPATACGPEAVLGEEALVFFKDKSHTPGHISAVAHQIHDLLNYSHALLEN